MGAVEAGLCVLNYVFTCSQVMSQAAEAMKLDY